MAEREIVKTPDVRVRVMELAPGDATEWHHHSEVRDFFVCLTGTVRVETVDPAGACALSPGATAEVAPGVVHRVVNELQDRSTYLLVQGVGRYDFIRPASG